MRLLFLFELMVPGFRLQRCSVVWIWRGIVLKKQKSALRVAAASVVDAKTKVQSRNRPATTMEPAAAAAFTSGVTRAPLRIASASAHGIIACLERHNSHTTTTVTMAAIYKPTEAIALLRPTFVLPRIHASQRRAHIGRIAFSTTHHAQATHSSTSSPPPKPQRKSISLTGDTGQVRWSELSPGEKAVRTTQQSFNLVVVLVGIVATVKFPLTPPLSASATLTTYQGRRWLLSLLRCLQSLLQDRLLQPRDNYDTQGRPMSETPRPRR